MWLRRAYYYAQPATILLLPVWLIVARGMAPDSLGAQDAIIFLSWPALAVGLLVGMLLTWGRRAVRVNRAVTWPDVAALSVWWGVAILYGVFISLAARAGAGILSGVLLLVSLAVLAFEVWQLVQAARRRVQTVLADFEAMAKPGASARPVSLGNLEATRVARGDGKIIRIDPPQR